MTTDQNGNELSVGDTVQRVGTSPLMTVTATSGWSVDLQEKSGWSPKSISDVNPNDLIKVG
jgi:hypothetical protein